MKRRQRIAIPGRLRLPDRRQQHRAARRVEPVTALLATVDPCREFRHAHVVFGCATLSTGTADQCGRLKHSSTRFPGWGAKSGSSTCAIDRTSGNTKSEEHTSELQSLMRISY